MGIVTPKNARCGHTTLGRKKIIKTPLNWTAAPPGLIRWAVLRFAAKNMLHPKTSSFMVLWVLIGSLDMSRDHDSLEWLWENL